MQRDKFLVYQYVDCLISHLSTLLLLLTIKPIQRWRENLRCLQLSLMYLLLNECAFVSEEREIKELRVVCIPVFCTLTDPTAICTPTQEIPNIWDWTDTAYQQKREEWGCKFKCRQLLAQQHNPQSKTRPSLIKILVSLLDQQSPIESAQLWVRTIYFAFISGWRGCIFEILDICSFVRIGLGPIPNTSAALYDVNLDPESCKSQYLRTINESKFYQ